MLLFVVACCLSSAGLMHFTGNHLGPRSVETQAYPHTYINSSHGPVQAPDCTSHASTFALGRISAFCNDRKWVRIGGDSRDAGRVRWFQVNTALCKQSCTWMLAPGNFLSRSGSYLHESLCSASVQSVAVSHTTSADEVTDRVLTMCWLAVHNHCFLTPDHVLGSFSTSTSPLYFSIFLFCLLEQSAFVLFIYISPSFI